MWVLIDNYDSFTHILHHYLLQSSGKNCVVLRNDQTNLKGIIALAPERLIISPGPQTPRKAGISLEAIDYFHDKIPILGVCLGHQALGLYFGDQLQLSPTPMHGKTSLLAHNGHPIFEGIAQDTEVMRYHSLCIKLSAHSPLQAIAFAQDDQVLMGLAHKSLPLIGLQYHPESIGTIEGQKMIDNWAKLKW